jgi:ethanolamine utilization protein EutN
VRLGIVRGHVVLNSAVPELKGLRLVVVEPVTAENLEASKGDGGGKCLVAVDELGAALGQIVGITEGREAANPFWPKPVPVDAYCALIAQHVIFQPAVVPETGSEVRK